MAGRIAKQIEADSISLVKVINDTNFIQENGFSPETGFSMYIPNSYEFYWNTSAEQFRARMLKEYKNFWNPDRLNKAKKQNMSPQEVSILASIVQKETSTIQERPGSSRTVLKPFKR
ncbi:MAG: endolytic transglycosylase MltG [Flavobacteriaceae bacterium]|nr:endolytic transglycosylase MltG [Flavobacteriaceae bacterium]